MPACTCTVTAQIGPRWEAHGPTQGSSWGGILHAKDDPPPSRTCPFPGLIPPRWCRFSSVDLNTAPKREAPKKGDWEVEAGDGKVGVQPRTNIEPSILPRAGKGGGQGTEDCGQEVGTLAGKVAALASQRHQEVEEASRWGLSTRYLPLGVPQPLQ